MTDKEREQILKMIEDGKVSPEEGLKLMQVLDQESPEDEVPAPEAAADTGSAPPRSEPSGMDIDPRIAHIKSTVRRLWQIPLWIGVAVIILSAAGMYALIQAGHMNFWFYCLIIPLLLGVLVIALAAGSRRARWIFVDVQQKPGEKPQRIFLGFPLPLKFTAWFMRTFGGMIDGLNKSDVKVEQVVQFLETGFSEDEPLVVNVDEGEGGDRVKVYIG
jgi:SHOCT-like domain